MKRMQIYLEPEMDEALAAEAARDGVSKASIIRRLIAAHTQPQVDHDAIGELVGQFNDAPGRVDDVVYGP